jgi:hypothetical protein
MTAQVQHVDVEVKPSKNYQSLSFSFRLVFDPPLTLEEAKFEADVAYNEIKELADKRLSEMAASAAPSTNAVAPQPSIGGDTWATAFKPNNAGTFRYIPTSVMDRSAFIALAESKLESLGLNPDDVTIFDDRGGDKGIESGGGHYSAGKVKAKPDGKMIQAMGGKAIVANIDFAGPNDLKVSLTKDAKTALSAFTIAQQLSGTPF